MTNNVLSTLLNLNGENRTTYWGTCSKCGSPSESEEDAPVGSNVHLRILYRLSKTEVSKKNFNHSGVYFAKFVSLIHAMHSLRSAALTYLQRMTESPSM